MAATVDPTHHQLDIHDTDLAALCHLTAPGPQPAGRDADAAWDTLTNLGVTDGRRLPGWIAEIGEIVAAPALQISVELYTTHATMHQLWATPIRAVIGSPTGNDRRQLHTIEVVMIPLEIARLVGLGRRPVPAADTPIRLPSAALAAAVDTTDDGDTAAARQGLTDAGLTTTDADLITELCTNRRRSWRVTTAWASSPHQVDVTDLVVLDAGDAGLWHSKADDTTDPATTLTPSRPSHIWRQLLALFPATPRNEQTPPWP